MLTHTVALYWGRKITRNKLGKQIFIIIIIIIMRRNYKCMRGHKCSVYKYSLHVNNHEIDQEKQNKTVARWKLITTETWPRFSLLIYTVITEMFIQPKTHWNIKKDYYSNGNQFKRKICKESLEIFLFMQITNFLADLCCILAVFKYKCLKIAAT